MTVKVQHGAGTVLYLDYINVNIPIGILQDVSQLGYLQDVSIRVKSA